MHDVMMTLSSSCLSFQFFDDKLWTNGTIELIFVSGDDFMTLWWLSNCESDPPIRYVARDAEWYGHDYCTKLWMYQHVYKSRGTLRAENEIILTYGYFGVCLELPWSFMRDVMMTLSSSFLSFLFFDDKLRTNGRIELILILYQGRISWHPIRWLSNTY